MTRLMRRLSVLVLAIASSAVALASEPQQSESATAKPAGELRVYHVGDLPLFNDTRPEKLGDSQSGPIHEPPIDEGRLDDPVDVALFVVREFYGMPAQRLGPGLIAIQEDDEGHATFVQAMNALRATEGEPITLQIAIRRVTPTDLENVRAGMPLTERVGELTLAHQQVIHLGLPATISSATERAFVDDLNPIVGTGSVSLDPHIAGVESGAVFNVHAGEGDDGRTMLRISGEVSRVTLDQHLISGATDQAVMESTFQLPTTDRRSISSAVSAPEGVEVVFAIVHFPGEDETEDQGEYLALTATVWSVD